MMDMVVLGCLGGVLALQGWMLWDFRQKSAKWTATINDIEGSSGDILDGLDSLAPILQVIIERLDDGLEMVERVPDSPLAPIMQQGIAALVQRWIDNTTNVPAGTWPDAEQRNELPAGSPESTS